jgi:hypothetical protein
MKLARVILGAVVVLAMGAISPLAPVSGELPQQLPRQEQFVQGKGKGKGKTASKAKNKVLRKHLASAKAADRKLRTALRDATKVRGPYGGYRDRAVHDMKLAQRDLRELEKNIKHILK